MTTVEINWCYHHSKVTDKIVIHMFTMFKQYMDYQVRQINKKLIKDLI